MDQSVPLITPSPKVNWLLSLIGAVILIFGIVIGLLIGKYVYSPKIVQIPIPIVSASPTPVSIADPTANWKTYTNPQYGFSLQYPSTWKNATDPNAVKNGNLEFRLQTNNNEFVTGTVFDGKADTSNDLTWSKRISLSNNKSLLITYTDNLGPGSKGGSIDIKIFDQILSTFKLVDVTGKSCQSDVDCGSGYTCMVATGIQQMDRDGKPIDVPKTCYPKDVPLLQ